MCSTELVRTDAALGTVVVTGPTVTLRTVGDVGVAEPSAAVPAGRRVFRTELLVTALAGLPVVRTDRLPASVALGGVLYSYETAARIAFDGIVIAVSTVAVLALRDVIGTDEIVARRTRVQVGVACPFIADRTHARVFGAGIVATDVAGEETLDSVVRVAVRTVPRVIGAERSVGVGCFDTVFDTDSAVADDTRPEVVVTGSVTAVTALGNVIDAVVFVTARTGREVVVAV